MNIYQEFRPHKWSEIIGHKKIVAEMLKRSRDKNFPTALYFPGISGSGKTTIARLIAMSIKCENLQDGEPCGKCRECRDIVNETFMLDNFVYNGADFNKDDVSKLHQILSTKSIMSKSGKKIVFIDEFQKVLPSSKAHDEFLSILEAKRPNVHFLLTSMDDSSTSKALKNRTEIVRLHEVDSVEIAEYLLKICEKKGIKIDQAKAEVLLALAENSRGSVRTACSYLEICIYREIWTEEEILREIDIATPKVVLNLCGWLLTGNIEVMRHSISEETLIDIRRLLLTVYKKQMGLEVNSKEIGNLFNQPVEKVQATLNELNTLQGRVSRELLETTLLNLVGQNKSEKMLLKEEPRRRVAK